MRKVIIKLLLPVLVFTGLSVTVGISAEPEPVAPKLLARFEIPKDGQMIVLPVTMDGKSYPFLVDTGSAYNTFDESLVSLLGKPRESIESKGNDGKMHSVNVYYAPDAKLGDLSFRTGGPVLCVDLDELRQLSGLEIRGVIGMGFLRRYVVQIDTGAGTLSLLKSGDEATAPADWGQPNLMRMARQGSPVILGQLFDKYETSFLIDTGYADTGTLSAKLFNQLRKEKLFKKVSEIPIETLAGKGVGVSARVDGFSVGKTEYKGIIFDLAPRSNMLGMGFVSRQKLTFDFPNLKAYITKGNALARIDQNDMSGLHLLKKTGGVIVYSVDKGSPAVIAGLKKDDLLYQINGQHVSKISLWKVRQIFRSEAGKKIEVVFQRGKKYFKTSFVLKKLI